MTVASTSPTTDRAGSAAPLEPGDKGQVQLDAGADSIAPYPPGGSDLERTAATVRGSAGDVETKAGLRVLGDHQPGVDSRVVREEGRKTERS